jgi:hypothetical protein
MSKIAKGEHRSTSTEFKKGVNPWNKGKSCLKGPLSNHWKGGKPRCLDCNKELAYHYSKYCLDHTYLHRKHHKSTFVMPKCIDCKETLKSRYIKRCKKCFIKSVSGENSYLWKGGITKASKLERSKFRYKIQKMVLERDNYTCQMCNIRGVSLQVDHIQSWSEYVELRFDMNNCRTLCQKCHYKVTFNRDMPEHIKDWGHGFNLVERIMA